jgi:hypothetical protein
VSVQDRCMVCTRRTMGLEVILDAPLGDELKWKLVSVLSEIVLILTQDRCAVFVERTIGLESFWTHTMQLLGDVGHVESHFFLFGESVSVRAR